jgi:hypothetical protein
VPPTVVPFDLTLTVATSLTFSGRSPTKDFRTSSTPQGDFIALILSIRVCRWILGEFLMHPLILSVLQRLSVVSGEP